MSEYTDIISLLSSDDGRHINKFSKFSVTYNSYYLYWREQLFERVMRLFIWEDTYTNENGKISGVLPREIESRLILAGHCGITKINGERELTAMFGSFYGVTKYYDVWKNYVVRCPIYSGSRTIGKDVIVINNTSIRNSLVPLIHHYSTLLAHTEVTLADLMINARDSGGVPVATTEKQKVSISEYQSKRFNGQYGVVTDIGNLGVNFAGSDRHTTQDVYNVMEIREKLIKSFYSDIGVRSAYEKRNNTIQAEVEADTSLLLLNLSDMLKQREQGAEQVNELYGTNWSVHIAEEIDYGAENQRIQFDTNSELHVQESDDDATILS